MTTPDNTSALRALLITDAVDSTRLTQALGDAAMAQHWAVHDRAARDLLATWRGHEIDKTDGMLLMFDSAADAVGYALAYHRAIGTLALPFKCRAGIHVGEVVLRANPADDVARGAKPTEVDGIALPIAARVMSTALGGQTLLSGDARRALGVTQARLQSHGHWRMQGVAEPVELFEVGDAGDGEAPFTPPPDDGKVYRVVRQGELWQPVREIRHSVPAERDSFVGRQEPLQALARKFDDGARLVSVLGMGGTGKTRLVTRFAWTWLGEFPGGVWFCDLSQARSVDGICFAVAQGLDVPLGKTDPVVQLAHAINGRGRCLVILDNFEQVARHAEETLGRWLDRAAQARFIVTTREVLGIVGEETFALAPLGASDAAALFVQRARSAKSGFQPSADDTLAIEQLVKVLDGLPLAIELAAARVRAMPPRVLLARMNERFGVLLSRAGRHDRQATLRAAFDWSWELLSEAEKAALAQLSVFEGGFTLTSVEAVLDLSMIADAPGAGDVMLWLVDKSFVRALADERFDLLESVREYAGEHLRTEGRFAQSGAEAEVATQRRHGEFFATREGDRAVAWSNADLDNMVVACRRAVAREDGVIALRVLSEAWRRIKLRGPYRLGVELAMLVRTTTDCLDHRMVVELDLIAGSACHLSGLAVQAEALLDAAVLGARRDGSAVFEGRALSTLAPLQAQHGRLNEAEASHIRALSLARSGQDRPQECSVLNHIASFCESLGRLSEAQAYYEQALRLACENHDRRGEGGSAGNLGQYYANQGRAAEARVLYSRAVDIARELDDHPWEANARCNLGLLHLSEGRLLEAKSELKSALNSARELGHVRLLSFVACNLGLVEAASGHPAVALKHFTEAVGIARATGDQRAEGQFLTYLGLHQARQNKFSESRECFDRGSELLTAVSDQISLGILLCSQSEAESLSCNDKEAQAALARAEAIAAKIAALEVRSEFSLSIQRARSLLAQKIT